MYCYNLISNYLQIEFRSKDEVKETTHQMGKEIAKQLVVILSSFGNKIEFCGDSKAPSGDQVP